MKVVIEYCGTCNYRPIAANLSIFLKKEFGVEPVLVHSHDMGVFEVVVDGKMLFSKRESGRFPDHAEIIDLIKSRHFGQDNDAA